MKRKSVDGLYVVMKVDRMDAIIAICTRTTNGYGAVHLKGQFEADILITLSELEN